jgi:hypothetical protein
MGPVMILRGEPAKLAGSGSGYGYGDGSGSGYGYGYGDGSGSGYGYGYGDGSGSGSGSGSGYGYGYGDGSGSGYGSGDGDGSGSGSGSGSGYGSGSGSGYGYGDGSGSGSGYGYGDGDGSGYGSGSKAYWLATVSYFSAQWPEPQRQRLDAVKAEGATIAFWRSDAAGQPTNDGGEIESAAPGVVHLAAGPLNLCHPGTLHATFMPPKWSGERWWIVAMHGETIEDGQDDKIGALKREILGECL